MCDDFQDSPKIATDTSYLNMLQDDNLPTTPLKDEVTLVFVKLIIIGRL